VFAPAKQRQRETDPVSAVAPIGAALAARERHLAERLARHIVLRTGPVIAERGDNLLTQTLRQLRGGGTIAAADAPRFCPTPADDVARVIGAMHDQLDCAAQCWGIFHYHSSDPASHYEFVEVLLAAAAQFWQLDAQVAAEPAAAGGAAFPLLGCQRIRDTFGIQQLPWRKAIPALLKSIYAAESS
jgi:dTDP-4-dehydrorhamnose reductase